MTKWFQIVLVHLFNVIIIFDSRFFSDMPGLSGNWIEIAYGTSTGMVRVIVQHPETVGQGPQLFQTFTVHRFPITKVVLSEKHLISGQICVVDMYFNCNPI